MWVLVYLNLRCLGFLKFGGFHVEASRILGVIKRSMKFRTKIHGLEVYRIMLKTRYGNPLVIVTENGNFSI
ncbi:hypothetical protein HanIR_Chr12g0586871 [Helianthus annuus]|nr:hypothetical protein HanIR_Chr12g0586871 [Helianthus annuus]